MSAVQGLITAAELPEALEAARANEAAFSIACSFGKSMDGRPVLYRQSDDGHGWFCVPYYVAAEVPGISRCSYMERDERVAYLEEDCDIAAFMRHWHPVPILYASNPWAWWGAIYEIVEIVEPGESLIRRCPRFAYP